MNVDTADSKVQVPSDGSGAGTNRNRNNKRPTEITLESNRKKAAVQPKLSNWIRIEVTKTTDSALLNNRLTNNLKTNQVSKKNGNPLTEDFSYDHIAGLWKDGVGEPLADISAHDEFRIHDQGIIIITYTFTKPTSIADYISNQQFIWEYETPSGVVETYSCKFLDLYSLEKAAVGDALTVTIKGLGGVVPIEIINDWMLHYGVFVDDPRYFFLRQLISLFFTCSLLEPSLHKLNARVQAQSFMQLCQFSRLSSLVQYNLRTPSLMQECTFWQHKLNVIAAFFQYSKKKILFFLRFAKDPNGLNIDEYIVTLTLTYLIPVHLPILGRKARIYYHGIPKQCTNCWELEHIKPECTTKDNPITWLGYIESLRQLDIPDKLFGNWLDVNNRVNLRARGKARGRSFSTRGRGDSSGLSSRGARGTNQNARGHRGTRGRGRGRG